CGLLACALASAAMQANAEMPAANGPALKANSELQRRAAALDSTPSETAAGLQREAIPAPQKQAAAKDAPASRGSLFGDDTPAETPPPSPPPKSRDSLFGDDVPAAAKPKPATPESRDSLFGDAAPA